MERDWEKVGITAVRAVFGNVGVAWLVLASGLGCASPAKPVVNSPVSVASAGPASSMTGQSHGKRYLLWLVSTKNQPSMSFVVEQEPSGACTTRLRADGVWLTADGQLYRWEEKVRKVPVSSKAGVAEAERNDNAVGEAMLTDVATGASKTFEWPDDMRTALGKDRDPADAEMPNEVDTTVRLEGSIGPHLVIIHSGYFFEGGAHGYTTTQVRVWNLNEAAEEKLEDWLPRGGAWEKLQSSAKEKFAGDDSVEKGSEPKVVGLLPTFDGHGRLDLGYVFKADACYACTHGPWPESYSVTVRVSGPLPERLETFASPPKCVRTFAEQHQETEIGGWNEVRSSEQIQKGFDKWFKKP